MYNLKEDEAFEKWTKLKIAQDKSYFFENSSWLIFILDSLYLFTGLTLDVIWKMFEDVWVICYIF